MPACIWGPRRTPRPSPRCNGCLRRRTTWPSFGVRPRSARSPRTAATERLRRPRARCAGAPRRHRTRADIGGRSAPGRPGRMVVGRLRACAGVGIGGCRPGARDGTRRAARSSATGRGVDVDHRALERRLCGGLRGGRGGGRAWQIAHPLRGACGAGVDRRRPRPGGCRARHADDAARLAGELEMAVFVLRADRARALAALGAGRLDEAAAVLGRIRTALANQATVSLASRRSPT